MISRDSVLSHLLEIRYHLCKALVQCLMARQCGSQELVSISNGLVQQADV
jgi:hypothetical protein